MRLRNVRRKAKKVVSLLSGVFLMGCLLNLLTRLTAREKDLSEEARTPAGGGTLAGDENECSERPDARRSGDLFFVETSGERCLTPRQACSVESAARTNPHWTVAVHMATQRPPGPVAVQRRSCPISDRVRLMANVRFEREDVMEHVRDTPLWTLKERSFDGSHHPLTHHSDAVRVGLLWKYGGVYVDLDCVVLRPLHCLNNTVGLVDYQANWVENGVMSFEPAHPFLWFLMKYMAFAYRPEEYMSLGPSTLTDAIKYFCAVDELAAQRPYRCRHNVSLTLQPWNAFYAVNFQQRSAFYRAPLDPLDVAKLSGSFLSHVYDAGRGRPAAPQSLYDVLARQYCPVVHAMAISQHGQF